jgi:Ca-activated chloride channel family protein
MTFKDIWLLLLLPLIIVLLDLFKSRRFISSIRFSSVELLKRPRPTLRLRLARKLVYLRAVTIVLFILALARPRSPQETAQVQTEGVDIVLAIDCSGSMLAEDFKIDWKRQNRLYAVKKVVEEFIAARRNDRIGMIAFAAGAYTVCPLTLDYGWLMKNLARVEIGTIEDGTAIGSAISSSLNRLRDTQAKTKLVILLTDGINNSGKIAPLMAAEAARALGIKIYTIGAGSKGLVPYPAKDAWGQSVYRYIKNEIDEETLQRIAQETGGRYFRATDTDSLRKIYREIDALEKTTIEESGFQQYDELFLRFLLPALALLMVELVLSNTVSRKLP